MSLFDGYYPADFNKMLLLMLSPEYGHIFKGYLKVYYKLRQLVYYKVRQLNLIQSATTCYYKVRQLFYYKVRQVLLQSAIVLLQSATGITKWDGSYKVQQNTPAAKQ